MSALHTETSIEICASSSAVHTMLVDFHTWPAWSPWLYLQPDALVNYHGEAGELGHGYDWQGEKIGVGSMTLESRSPQRIDYKLQFFKPFKSTAAVRFELREISATRTQVRWCMDSRLPFFLFFMTKTMNGLIRADYRRGLLMLKDFVEQDAVPTFSELMGVTQLECVSYVGLRSTTNMQSLAESIKESFKRLHEAVAAVGGDNACQGASFSFCEQLNYKRDQCTFMAALAVNESLPVEAPLVSASRPACQALKLVHTGAYRHLGNAWSVLMSEAGHRKLKTLKSVSPFEQYINDGQNTNTENLLTELYLPLR